MLSKSPEEVTLQVIIAICVYIAAGAIVVLWMCLCNLYSYPLRLELFIPSYKWGTQGPERINNSLVHCLDGNQQIQEPTSAPSAPWTLSMSAVAGTSSFVACLGVGEFHHPEDIKRITKDNFRGDMGVIFRSHWGKCCHKPLSLLILHCSKHTRTHTHNPSLGLWASPPNLYAVVGGSGGNRNFAF